MGPGPPCRGTVSSSVRYHPSTLWSLSTRGSWSCHHVQTNLHTMCQVEERLLLVWNFAKYSTHSSQLAPSGLPYDWSLWSRPLLQSSSQNLPMPDSVQQPAAADLPSPEDTCLLPAPVGPQDGPHSSRTNQRSLQMPFTPPVYGSRCLGRLRPPTGRSHPLYLARTSSPSSIRGSPEDTTWPLRDSQATPWVVWEHFYLYVL